MTGLPHFSRERCPFGSRLIHRLKEEQIQSALSRDGPREPIWNHEEREKELMRYLLLCCTTGQELATWQVLSAAACAQIRATSGLLWEENIVVAVVR